MTQIVIMPGGFHPFHAGHYALYQSARRAFPKADVYVAATDDTSTRPFPFPVKEKLAQLAGVDKGRFMRVKSPFRAEEITAPYNPEKDVLIFVRSEKDADKPPQAGGAKRDGSPSYLQPLQGQTRYEPFAKHAYMAYLPTVEFGPGMTSATEIRTAWPTLNEKRKTALVMSLYPRTQGNAKLAATVVGLLDAAIGSEQGVAEDKIRLSTDPNWYGAEVGDYRASGPVVNIPANRLVGFEPDDKMNQPASKANVQKIVSGLKQGAKLPPLLVRQYKNGYQVLDGHHRFWAYKLLGVKSIPAQVVPAEDIEEITKQGVAEAADKCPPATQDITLNLKNRQKAIDEYGYGPLNPDLPNTKFWMKKVDEWNLDSMEEAQQSLCGNCAAFDIRQDTLDCIAQGIDSDSPQDAEGVIDAGDLGYCKFLKFKCASRRTCDAWVTGGPLQDKPVDENQGWAATYETSAQNFVGGMKASYQARENQPVAEQDLDYIEEKWSQKYKSSINCANPKGFSQKAHCAGRKK